MGKFICSTEIQIKSQKNFTDYNRSGKKIKFLNIYLIFIKNRACNFV